MSVPALMLQRVLGPVPRRGGRATERGEVQFSLYPHNKNFTGNFQSCFKSSSSYINSLKIVASGTLCQTRPLSQMGDEGQKSVLWSVQEGRRGSKQLVTLLIFPGAQGGGCADK